ncbi:DNA methyltransferase [Pseudomonas juntendi]|nr:DNA methyltransferase [Pseudomonas juntendi]
MKLAFIFMSTTNPKLQTKHAKSLFKYYAGFSDDFVISAIQKEQEQLNQDALIVLDPWNGSGTTTHACNQLGVKSIGVDRNPAMAVFAQARAACNSSIEQILTTPALPSNVRSDDPLLTWFMPSSAKHIRGIEEGIKVSLHLREEPLVI